jgi:hypothetical protein
MQPARLYLLILAVLLPSCALHGQSDPIVLPLDYTGRHLYITVTDEHLGPLTLMLDTGFQRTTLAAPVAKKGDVRTHFWERSLSYNGFGTGKVKRRYETLDVALRSGSTLLFDGSALVTDIGDFSSRVGHPMDGFLGWDFFRKWCVTLDYVPARLTLREPTQCPTPSGAYASLRADWTPQGLLLPSRLTFANGNTAPALLHFDSGSDISLLLNTQFRGPAGLDEKPASATDESQGFGVNGGYTTDLVQMKRVDLGDELQFAPGRDMMVAIAHTGAFARVHWWEGPSAIRINRDGVIGNALLARFRWTFDPQARRIYAVPAATN